MSQGKKTSPKVKERVLATLAETDNMHETARQTGVPVSTVQSIRNNATQDDGFAQLRMQKRQEIIDAAYAIAAQGTMLIRKRMNQIAENDEVLAATDLRELSTPTATMIDKALLMEGKPTEIIAGNLNFGDF